MRFFIKCLKEKFAWLKDVSAHILDNALQDLLEAYKKFWKGLSKFPRFKKKGLSESFAYRTKTKFKVIGRKLRIERLGTPIKLREELRFDGVPCQVTISTKGGKWFASVLVKLAGNPYSHKSKSSDNQVGVDLGVSDLATLSDGTVFLASQPLKASLKRLAKLQRRLAKKVKGSNRHRKLRSEIAKLHYRVSCQRSATLHGLTDHLTANFNRIVIEDLNVKGMVKNHCLAGAVSDCGFGEFRRQVEYKSRLRGRELIVADRWFPSTKLCMNCGQTWPMPLSKRVFTCDCGVEPEQRDQHAAKNLMNYVETEQGSTQIST